MNKIAFESTLRELRELMAEDRADEAVFQTWFEKHEIAFESLGYDVTIPHPELCTSTGETFIPDFMARRTDGLWEIVEIKRPDTKILKDTNRRQTFYATLESYYSQCRDYVQFFDESAHRAQFDEKYGHEIQKRPHAVLVAGRNEGLDKAKVHNIVADRGSSIVLQTYDDILERIEFFRVRQFGRFENLPGLSIHTILRATPIEDQEMFIFDVGIHSERDRISVLIDQEGDLCLRVVESTGDVRLLRARTPELLFRGDVPIYLAFEVGVGEDASILDIDSDGQSHAYLTVERGRLALDVPLHFVVGSNVLGDAPTQMNLYETAIYRRTLEFAERYELANYFFGRIQSGLNSYVEFSGDQFMYTHGHPNFPQPENNGEAPKGRSLVQVDSTRTPVYRTIPDANDNEISSRAVE